MLKPRTDKGIVFYDGVCGLCDRWVRFLLKRDPQATLQFSPLQGETAKRQPNLPKELRTIILIGQPGTTQESISIRSEAALRLLDHVGGFWRIVSWLRMVPRPLRDWIYDLIAARRYRWFGKFDTCPLPPAEWRNRFLP